MANFEALKRAGETVDFLIENTPYVEFDEKEKHRFDAVMKDFNTKMDLIQGKIDKILNGITDGYENQINHEYAKKFMEYMYRIEMNRLGGESVVKTVKELDTFMSIYKDKLSKMWEKYKQMFWKKYIIKDSEFIKKIQEIRNIELPDENASYREVYDAIKKAINSINLGSLQIQEKLMQMQMQTTTDVQLQDIKNAYKRFEQLAKEFAEQASKNSTNGVLSTAQKLELYRRLKQVLDTIGEVAGIESYSEYVERFFTLMVLSNLSNILRPIFESESRLTPDDVYTVNAVNFLYQSFQVHSDIFVKSALVDAFLSDDMGMNFFEKFNFNLGSSIKQAIQLIEHPELYPFGSGTDKAESLKQYLKSQLVSVFRLIDLHVANYTGTEIHELVEDYKRTMQDMTVHVKQEVGLRLTSYGEGIEKGYKDGYREGYETGYKEGYEEGMIEGGKIGARIGTQHGLQVGRISQLAETKEKLLLKGIHL